MSDRRHSFETRKLKILSLICKPGAIMKTLSLTLRVVPNAARSELVGPYGENGYKVRVKAPPTEGRANTALIEYFARELGISAGCIRITSGRKARTKQVEIEGVADATFRAKFGLCGR